MENCPACQHDKCACDCCDTGSKEKSYPQMNAEQLNNELATNKDLVVVNVLGKEHYDDCHITNSINIPRDELRAKEHLLDRGKKTVLYCAHYDCKASKEAFEILKSLGFKNMFLYEGGTKEWREKGFETEGPCKQSYLTKSC